MKKLLVTGASGFLGWQVCKKSPTDWQVVGAYHQSKTGIFPKLPSYQIDLTNKDAIWQMLKDTKPDAVFHLAAISGTGTCEKSPESSFPINVSATANLAEMCFERKVKFLFTSSEQVFDGTKGDYLETDKACPMNEYGKQKLAAETEILALGAEATIVRIAVLFGRGGPYSKSFLEQWVGKWQNSLPVTAFHDEIRSFLSGQMAANGLFHLLEQGASGLFHLGGRSAISRTEFAEKVVEIFGLEQAKISSISQADVEVAAFRPPDLSLNCSKIKGTGFQLKNLTEELFGLKKNVQSQAATKKELRERFTRLQLS